MHIAFLIPTIDRIGGAERQVLLLSQGLAARGWKVSVIALSGSGGDAASELRSRGIGFVSLEMRKGIVDPRGWIRMYRWSHIHQPDILHAHLPHATLMGRLSRVIAPVRVLVETIHSPATGALLRRSAYRLNRFQPDAVTAVSRAAADPWVAKRVLDPHQLAIIPNGIDVCHWKRDLEVRKTMRERLALGNDFVWIAVGRLDPVKDHATMLRACAMLPPNTRLLVAGAGPLERLLRHQATDLGLANKVEFLGFQNDVLPWLQVADGFVLSSRWEGLPMAFLEAAAVELPAVFTDIPAIRDLVSVQTRRCAPVGDPNALETAMRDMMDLPEPARRAIGKAARELVIQNFSFDSVMDQWERIYRALLALKPYPTRSGIAPSILRGRILQLQ